MKKTSTRPESDVLAGPSSSTNSAASVPGVSASNSLMKTRVGGGGGVSSSVIVSVNVPEAVPPVTPSKPKTTCRVPVNTPSLTAVTAMVVVAPARVPAGNEKLPVKETCSGLALVTTTVPETAGLLASLPSVSASA